MAHVRAKKFDAVGLQMTSRHDVCAKCGKRIGSKDPCRRDYGLAAEWSYIVMCRDCVPASAYELIRDDSLARFREVCPEAASIYADAERKRNAIFQWVAGAFTSDHVSEVDELSDRVVKQIRIAAHEWNHAKRGFHRFVTYDLPPMVVHSDPSRDGNR